MTSLSDETATLASHSSLTPLLCRLGFLRSKRDRVKSSKPSKKDKSAAKPEAISDAGPEAGSRESNSGSEVRVDDEGFVIREPVTDQPKELDNFYSDSDSSEDEESKKPIHVIIKPINGSNSTKRDSIAELKQTVKSLSISPSMTTSVSLASLDVPAYPCRYSALLRSSLIATRVSVPSTNSLLCR